MTKEEIKAIEEEYAKTETPVVSNNSAHRWTKDVPMVPILKRFSCSRNCLISGNKYFIRLIFHPGCQSRSITLKTYEEAVKERWKMTTPMPESVKKLIVMNVKVVTSIS